MVKHIKENILAITPSVGMVLFVMLSLSCMVQKEGREGMCTSIREDNFWSIANTNLKGPYKIIELIVLNILRGKI